MKLEQLKQIAKYMGYETKMGTGYVFIKDGVETKYPEQPSLAPQTITPHYSVFDPLTNAEQSMELLKMLHMSGWKTAGSNLRKIHRIYNDRYDVGSILIEDESLEQAILNAAWEHISNE